MKKTIFSAKILLFGEHTILRGSRALAVPFFQRNCHWSWKEGHEDVSLTAFADFLAKNLPLSFKAAEFRAAIHRGLYLRSNIPNGYGLGSSGALCVAVASRFATVYGHQLLRENPKGFFAQMEAFFHGASSGIDPLIIYLGRDICLYGNGDYQTVELASLTDGLQFFLLDTQQKRSTAPWVERFTQKYDKEKSFRELVDTNWATPTNRAIDALLSSEMDQLWTSFEKISTFQYHHINEWLLAALLPIWSEGLKSNNYLLKICGAGGGGYCLGLTKDWAKTKQILADFSLTRLDIPHTPAITSSI